MMTCSHYMCTCGGLNCYDYDTCIHLRSASFTFMYEKIFKCQVLLTMRRCDGIYNFFHIIISIDISLLLETFS